MALRRRRKIFQALKNHQNKYKYIWMLKFWENKHSMFYRRYKNNEQLFTTKKEIACFDIEEEGVVIQVYHKKF